MADASHGLWLCSLTAEDSIMLGGPMMSPVGQPTTRWPWVSPLCNLISQLGSRRMICMPTLKWKMQLPCCLEETHVRLE